MSDRFYAWLAERAAQDSLRLQMFILAVLVVALYLAVSWWPVKYRSFGKALIIELGVVVYVIIFAFSVWTLGLTLGLDW